MNALFEDESDMSLTGMMHLPKASPNKIGIPQLKENVYQISY